MIKYLIISTSIFCLMAFTSVAQEADSSGEHSQSANQRYIEIYKENADFSYTSPKGELGAPSKYVLIGKLTTTYMLVGTKNSRFAFAAIPDFTVRVRDEVSAGVRTPSFKLSGVLYARLGTSAVKYQYAELGFTHHSNGQDDSAINPDGSLNTKTGNFSTNYLTASYRSGYEFAARSRAQKFSTNYRVGLEWHKWFNYEPALQNDYGFTRLLYNFSWRNHTRYFSTQNRRAWQKSTQKNLKTTSEPILSTLEKESVRLNLEVSYAINKMTVYNLMSAKKRLNVEAVFHGSLPFMNRAMVMVSGGYYGEDPYNIYYRDKYGYVRIGISTGFMRYRVTGLGK